jgi:hypothetical protein
VIAARAELPDALRREGVELVLARTRTRLRERLAKGGFDATGETAYVPSVRDAVAARSPA